jgi:hypothetical protein
MRMNWQTLLSGVSSLIARLTGLQVHDADAPEPFTDPRVKGKLSFKVTSSHRIGGYEIRYGEKEITPEPTEEEPDPEPYSIVVASVCFHREFTLSVRFEGYDQTADNDVINYLEEVDARFGFPSSHETLLGLNCTLVSAEPSVKIPSTQQGRVFSCGKKDFIFLAVVNEEDDAGGDVGYIHEVTIDSMYLRMPDGTPSKTQVHVQVTQP